MGEYRRGLDECVGRRGCGGRRGQVGSQRRVIPSIGTERTVVAMFSKAQKQPQSTC